MLTLVIDSVCRAEGARVLAGLIRRFGDFELAEDALQGAFAKALEVWPAQGLPATPAAWLTTVAQRRALDLLRRRHSGPLYTEEVPDVAAPDTKNADVHPADLSGRITGCDWYSPAAIRRWHSPHKLRSRCAPCAACPRAKSRALFSNPRPPPRNVWCA